MDAASPPNRLAAMKGELLTLVGAASPPNRLAALKEELLALAGHKDHYDERQARPVDMVGFEVIKIESPPQDEQLEEDEDEDDDLLVQQGEKEDQFDSSCNGCSILPHFYTDATPLKGGVAASPSDAGSVRTSISTVSSVASLVSARVRFARTRVRQSAEAAKLKAANRSRALELQVENVKCKERAAKANLERKKSERLAKKAVFKEEIAARKKAAKIAAEEARAAEHERLKAEFKEAAVVELQRAIERVERAQDLSDGIRGVVPPPKSKVAKISLIPKKSKNKTKLEDFSESRLDDMRDDGIDEQVAMARVLLGQDCEKIGASSNNIKAVSFADESTLSDDNEEEEEEQPPRIQNQPSKKISFAEGPCDEEPPDTLQSWILCFMGNAQCGGTECGGTTCGSSYSDDSYIPPERRKSKLFQ